jgi:hypothetical protein
MIVKRDAFNLFGLVSSFGGKSYTFNVAYGVGKAVIDRLAADMSFQFANGRRRHVATSQWRIGVVKCPITRFFRSSCSKIGISPQRPIVGTIGKRCKSWRNWPRNWHLPMLMDSDRHRFGACNIRCRTCLSANRKAIRQAPSSLDQIQMDTR